ncbi:Leucine rich repeat-containing protein 2 [Elsinoe fawcettii]|nr:Leucine rich repeat-containing protein 2 [Elsinoe fawcettii]
MDYARGPPSPGKSALPRLSKLPTPQSSRTTTNYAVAPPAHAANPAKSIARLTSPTKPVQSIRPPARRVSGIPPPVGLTARPSSSQATRPASPSKTASIKPPVTANATLRGARPRPKSIQIGPSYGVHLSEDANDRLGALTSLSSSSRQFARDQSSSPSPGLSPFVTHATPQPRKPSGPSSLSDRTIQSLAKLPGTPASERRRSGIFTAESPGAPPARPASAMSGLKRPGMGAVPSSRTVARPTSPAKKPLPGTASVKRASVDYGRPAVGRRSISATIPRPSPAISSRKLAAPSTSSRLSTPQPPRTRTAADVRLGPAPKTARPATNKSQMPQVQSPPPLSPLEDSDGSVLEHDSAQPSSSFKTAIQRAKAAHRAARVQLDKKAQGEYDLFADPFNQKPKEDGHGAVRRRVDTARREGKLNIAALDLDAVPELVVQMYDSQSMADSGIAWHETVDLVLVNAADNAISCFTSDLFPDVDPEDAVHDDNLKASVFAGVERMDFRGNQLMTLPPGMQFLRRLTNINLSRNQLGNTALEVLTRISTLKDLNLASNNLSGFLTQDLKLLKDLENLNVSDNKILNIPDSIHELTHLRVLNASSNQLTGVPMDALEGLPLIELDVSDNALVGALFPFSVTGLKTIEQLNVANNSLASLAFSESVSLPSIRILKISNNRIVSLPDMSGWSELVTLAAGGNKFNQLPQGFSSLRRLRHADFSSNSMTRIDERVALMDSLESLVLSANPLVEKRFLTMSADSIKRALRPRMEPASTISVRSSDSFVDEAIDVRSPEESPSPFKISPAGALDLTAQGLVDDDADGLRQLLGQNDVRSLSLPRNKLTVIPYELSLAQNLTFLDLSMCDLGERYLEERLNLPMLQELQLSGNKISDFDPLLNHLNAPYLRSLDVSNNRLQGELPFLRLTFNHLTHLYAADNKIEGISLEALTGFHHVALPRNSLRALPAEIGLLWFEGLKQLDVTSNYFRVPNHETLNKGSEAVMAWLRTRIPDYQEDDETF